MKRAIWIGGIVFFALLTIAIAINLGDESSPVIVTSIPHTSTPSFRPTPTPTAQPRNSDLLDCYWWYQLRANLVGTDVCVLGHIETIVASDPDKDAVRIYLKANLPKGYRLGKGAPKAFYFFDNVFSSTDMGTDDCISATGTLSINNDGTLFMRLDGNLQKCSYR